MTAETKPRKDKQKKSPRFVVAVLSSDETNNIVACYGVFRTEKRATKFAKSVTDAVGVGKVLPILNQDSKP